MAAPAKTELAPDAERLFDVDVLVTIGTVYRGFGSKLKPDEAAFLLIAEHARTLEDNASAEYRFPGHAEGMFMTVTVANHTDFHGA